MNTSCLAGAHTHTWVVSSGMRACETCHHIYTQRLSHTHMHTHAQAYAKRERKKERTKRARQREKDPRKRRERASKSLCVGVKEREREKEKEERKNGINVHDGALSRRYWASFELVNSSNWNLS